MNVLRIPTHAMKMLIAPTMTVRTAVLVNWDSLEMVQFVKVRVTYHYSFISWHGSTC